MITLEDDFNDILLKAMRGQGIGDRELAAQTGVAPDLVARLCRGEFCDEGALPKLAPPLGLDPDALLIAASKAWQPRRVRLDGLEQFNTAFRDMMVNAFLIWDPATKLGAAFDTGSDARPIIEKAAALGVTIESLFITHTHNDHIADVPTITREIPGIPVYSNKEEPYPCEGAVHFSPGDRFRIGALDIETRQTSGHSVGGTTYFVTGLEKPVAVVGDAVFAGSMGGGMVSFAEAIRTNREQILSLPDETVICPGHGPLSTIAEEKRFNPFLKPFA